MKYSEASRAMRQARKKIEDQLSDDDVVRSLMENGHSPELSTALVKHAHLDLLNDKIRKTRYTLIAMAVASVFCLAILPFFAADTFTDYFATRGFAYIAGMPVVTIFIMLWYYSMLTDRKHLRNTL